MTDAQNVPGAPRPSASSGMAAFQVTPFARMARAHSAGTMADAMVAASFAGAVFFSLPADDARVPVLRYLIITMLPFAILSPLVGPLIDRLRGGHRFVLVASIVIRSVLCYFLIGQIHGAGAVFFLLALLLLMAQRAYQVARSALVPVVVRDDAELVEANSKLSVISGISGFIGVLPAAALIKLAGAGWALGLAMIVYAIGAVLALRIPSARPAEPAGRAEREELRGAGIIMAGSAMGLLRACVGFLTMLIAFDFRGGGRHPWEFGVVAGISVLSQLLGAALAPRIRAGTSEENLLMGALTLVIVGSVVALLAGDVLGASILGGTVGFAAGSGRQAFDAILQRDAPDANRGRSFARFETRFQVMWVFGSLLAVAFHLSAHVGFGIVLVASFVALASYVLGRLAMAYRSGTHRSPATAAAVEIESRIAGVSVEMRQRITAAPGAAFRRMRGGSVPPEAYEVDTDPTSYDPDSVDDTTWEQADPDWHSTDPTWVDSPATPIAPDPTHVPQEPVTQVDETPYPWQTPVEHKPEPGAFMADVDPAVSYPYPWTPDDPTVVPAEQDQEPVTRADPPGTGRPF